MAHQNHVSGRRLRLAQLVRLRTQSARLHSLDASHTPPKTDSPSLPPPPPPKDNAYSTSSNFLSNPPSALYTKSLFSRSVNSLSHSLGRAPSQGQPLSPDSNPITPLTTGSFGAPQHGSTGSQTGILGRGMTASPVPSGSGVSLNSANGGGEYVATPSMDGSTDSSDMNATKRKKPLFKLSSLGLKNKSRRDLSETASMSTSTSEYEESGKEEGDEGISVPWNFQHHIHVDEGRRGLPALSSAGFGDEEIAAIHARRKAAAAANLKNGPNAPGPPAQYSSARPASPVLRNPVPRSSSLARLRIDTPLTRLASAIGSNPSPSPRATGFGGGLLGSRGGDGASTTSESRSRSGSNPYVMVDGDVDAAEGVGDETLIEPFPYDAASVTTHQTHSAYVPSTLALSQAQTPRGPQVQRTQSDAGYVPFPSPGTPIPAHAKSSSSLTTDSSIFHGSASPSPSPSHSQSRQPTFMVTLPQHMLSPVRGETFRREKEGLHESPASAGSTAEHSQASKCSASEGSSSGRRTTAYWWSCMTVNPFDTSDIPATVEDVLDISAANSSLYLDNDDAEQPDRDITMQRQRLLSPTPPLVIDKLSTTQAPRISFHQEGSLDDWTSSLFSAISSNDATDPNDSSRSNIAVKPRPRLVAPQESEEDERAERRLTIRPLSPRPAPIVTLPPVSPAPKLPDVSFGRNISIGEHVRQARPPSPDDEEVEVEETKAGEVSKGADEPRELLSISSPSLPDISFGPNVSSLGKDILPPVTSPSRVASEPSLEVAASAPKGGTIGADGKSPLSPFLRCGPKPLPLPIPPDQIRAQLRPSKSIHGRSSRRESSSSLVPRSNPGDRDSGVSTVTVTQAKIVRRAVASVIDPDMISPPSASKRDSFASAFGSDGETAYEPEEEGSSQELKLERPGDDADGQSLLISGTNSGPPSSPSPTWPAPPPPPTQLDTDATPRPHSRLRATSMKRVSQVMGFMGGVFPSPPLRLRLQTESAPLPTPKGTLVPPPPPPKGKGIAPEARMLGSMTDTFGGWYTRSVWSRTSSVAPSLSSAATSWSRPRSSVASSPQTVIQQPSTAVPHPLLAPLHAFISPVDPSTRFTDLVEIAEGESGSSRHLLAPPLGTERPIPAGMSHVAIKRIALPRAPSVTSSNGEGSITANPTVSAGAGESLLSIKIASLLHELTLLKNLEHEHILLLDGVYAHTGADVNEGEDNLGEYPSASTAIALDTSLWIRMELMERSLADVIALVAEGLALQERILGRFTSDVLLGLDYLQKQPTNLLLNVAGVVKIADFSNAIRVPENAPMVTGAVGVIYWQAPEMRTGPYDALKVDVWSVGATVWELVETVPPFSIPASPSSQTVFLPPNSNHLGLQWPPLSHPGHYSKGFHEFLRLCGMDAATRPCPEELLNTQFIRNACGRAVIRQLHAQCRSMEEAIVARENAVSVES
ncbi:hypothetical protein BKA83DRAFT_4270702 [Pisolithus microcarpus]|nr:hypothetical protein BKA83DRAFT_4270702 [Pisolithus microcarpus]